MEGQRVSLATTYLNDTADSWYQGCIKTKEIEAAWDDFAEGLCGCFGERNMYDVIEEFNKLRQERTITDY